MGPHALMPSTGAFAMSCFVALAEINTTRACVLTLQIPSACATLPQRAIHDGLANDRQGISDDSSSTLARVARGANAGGS